MVAVLAVASAAGCASPPAEPADVVRTDSAGVRIVTSGAVDRPLPWRFDSVDVLRDTLGEPWPAQVVRPQQVLIDRAGRTYVLTRDEGIVRFGLDGRFDRTIGRPGSGPGEFRFPIALTAKGDTLVVHDVAKRALVRFSSGLAPVAEQQLAGALADMGAIAFRAGGLWFSDFIRDDSVQGVALRTDTAGGPPLAQVVVPHGASVRFSCIGIPQSTPLFSPTLNWAANGPRIVVNEQPGYSLALYEGVRLVAHVRRPLAARAPTVDDVRELYPDGLRLAFGDGRPGCVVPAEELAERQGLAEVLPFVHGVQLLSDGTIWASRTRFGSVRTAIDVFGSDGAYVGTVQGVQLPLGRYPNGDLLMLREDSVSAELVLQRVRAMQR